MREAAAKFGVYGMARAGMSELSVYSRLLLLHNSPTVPLSKTILPIIATILLIAWDWDFPR